MSVTYWRRPRLDPLEDRLVPAAPLPRPSSPDALVGAFVPGQGDIYRHDVTVAENAAPVTIDVVALMTGFGVDDMEDRSLNLVGNSNPGLVRTRLIDDDLKLTFAENQTGTAVISIECVDVAGESVRLDVYVTVAAPRPVPRPDLAELAQALDD